MNAQQTPCPIDFDDIQSGDLVRVVEVRGVIKHTYEFMVHARDSTARTLTAKDEREMRVYVPSTATIELLDRPAPPMEPLPTEPGSVIWVDEIDWITLDEPVKAILSADGLVLLVHSFKGFWSWATNSITAWHTAEPEFRTVSTAEELDNSRYGAVIRSELDGVAQNRGGYWQQIGSGHKFSSADIAGGWKAPFTVIWEGE